MTNFKKCLAVLLSVVLIGTSASLVYAENDTTNTEGDPTTTPEVVEVVTEDTEGKETGKETETDKDTEKEAEATSTGEESLPQTSNGEPTPEEIMKGSQGEVYAIDEEGTKTLQELVNEATNDSTIECEGITYTGNLEIKDGKRITLNFSGTSTINGKITVTGFGTTLSITGSGLTITNSSDCGLSVDEGALVSLDFEGKIYTNSDHLAIKVGRNNAGTLIVADNNLTVEGKEGAIAYYKSANITINGGTYKSINNMVFSDNGKKEFGGNHVTITKATLISNITSSGYISCGIYNANDTALTLKEKNSGDIKITANGGGAGIVVRGGKVIIDQTVIDNMDTGTAAGWVGDNKNLVSGKICIDKGAKYPAMDTIDVNINYSVDETGNEKENLVVKDQSALMNSISDIMNGKDSAIVDLDQGKNLSTVDATTIKVSVEETDATNDKKDYPNVKKIVGDSTLGKVLDITLKVKVNDESYGKMVQTNAPVSFEADVKDIMTDPTKDYKFTVTRIHNDSIETLSSSLNGSKLSFNSDKFSLFVVTYSVLDKTVNNSTNPGPFLVTFLDCKGETVKVEWVPYEGSATAPAGYGTYAGYTNVSANMDIKPTTCGVYSNGKYVVPNTADRS